MFARFSLFALAVVALIPSARADVTFTNLVDSTQACPEGGTFHSFMDACISEKTVAFCGFYKDGMGTMGFFSSVAEGGVLSKVATNNAADSLAGLGPLTGFLVTNKISGNRILFFGSYKGNAGNSGVFLESDGVIKPVITNGETNTVPGGGSFTGFGSGSVHGNNVAFSGTYKGGKGTEGIFLSSEGKLTTIVTDGEGYNKVPGGGTFEAFTGCVVSGNQVVFHGLFSGGEGIYLSSEGQLKPLATMRAGSNAVPGSGTFKGVKAPSISNKTVAFIGEYKEGTGTKGVFTVSTEDGTFTKIATNSDTAPDTGGATFSDFTSAPSISGKRVAFLSKLKGGMASEGIFLSTDGTLSKVIAVGEPLFGSTVKTLQFSAQGVDGEYVVFFYQLTNGRSGVAVAKTTAPV